MNRSVDLTVRQTVILGLISRGMTNRMVACVLSISEKTVKNHLSAIYAKIGVTGRTQAALYTVTCTRMCPWAVV